MANTLELSVHVTRGWNRPDPELVAALGRFPVANIGDAMERLGMVDAGINPIWDGSGFAGPALPVLGPPGDNLAVIQALDHIQPGDVVVINGFGHDHRALVGEQLSQRFQAAGAVGAVIDGYVRDRAVIAALRFPIFARGATPAGPYKNGPGVIGEPVAIGGVVASAGDIVVADSDGVIIVPRARAETVLPAVIKVAEHEAEMTAEVTARYS